MSVFLTIFTHGMPCFWLCSHLYFRLDSGGIAVVLMLESYRIDVELPVVSLGDCCDVAVA